MHWKHFIPLGIFVCLAITLGVGLHIHSDKVPSTLIGKPVPEFSLEPLYVSQEAFTNADLKQGISLLNVFASWCRTCHFEHPLLMQLKEYDVLPIYGLNWKDERAKAIKWLRKTGNPYTKLGMDVNGQVGIDLGVTGTPETFLIDEKGTILFKHSGALTTAIIKEEILPILLNNQKQDEELTKHAS